MSQEQFLTVIDRDEAEKRFREAIDLQPLSIEKIALDEALGRVLAEDVIAAVDVPSFDRSNYDGYAVRAADTYGAQEETPRQLDLLGEVAATGVVPRGEVAAGTAMSIATGFSTKKGSLRSMTRSSAGPWAKGGSIMYTASGLASSSICPASV